MFKRLISVVRHAKKYLLIIVFTLPASVWAQTTAEGAQGAVSSRSMLASQVGLDIMKQGGNAVDAAVAMGFALAVTYPSAGNLGGGGFMMLHTEAGEVLALDFRETAPGTAAENMFLDDSGSVIAGMSTETHLAAGIPGSVAGLLEALNKHGTFSREKVLAPAIKLAEEGFPLPSDIATQFSKHQDKFKKYAGSARSFIKKNKTYQAGEIWKQPDLALTLKLIAAQGRDGFYKGKVADLIVAEMEKGNGRISHNDLLSYEPVWRKPIHGTYRSFEIWGMPPPSSGGILVQQILNMLEPFVLDKSRRNQDETLHLMIEAERRAYADRAEYLGDSDFYPVPIERLIDKTYAKQRFSDFDVQKASNSDEIGPGAWPEESRETTHYSVMDAKGNAVSVTTTLNTAYGNKIVVDGAGFLLNNEMDDFSIKPGFANTYGLLGNKANAIAPNKRMLSSMSPTIVTLNGQPFLATGSPGGSTIITTTLQVLINVVDHNMTLASAVKSPRFHHQWKPNKVFYEPGALSEAQLSVLRSKNHVGIIPSPWKIGDANSVIKRKRGFISVSDPRSMGGALAY
ncbi:MAG: gamma-glutamyltransferase [Pseudomonadales bacterium]|nr:gamma-glutamyltransferase [Pseudomonadales bacterium]